MFFIQTVQNDIHEERPIKHFSWRHKYGFSSVMILITGHCRFVAVTLASVHRQGLFPVAKFRGPKLHSFILTIPSL
jgi:hypothetical protein